MVFKYFHKSVHFMLVASAFLGFSSLLSFEIRYQSGTEKVGYKNSNMQTNGELTLLWNFLKQGDIVFDVGANRGEWSQHALEKTSSIQLFAFEPIPEVFAILKMNFLSLSNVKIFAYALSNDLGKASFYHYLEHSDMSGFYDRPILQSNFNYNPPQQISVALETLDHFCSTQSVSKIDFLKIDTEGAEWKVLDGARNLLENHQIRAIQFEYGGCYTDAGTTLKQVVQLLTKNGYIIFRIIPTGLIHISHWSPSLENFEYSNYFAIYQEDMPSYDLVKF